MNETLTRTLSGVVYIIILVGSALFHQSFLALFGIFLLICVFEFCELTGIQKGLPLLISALLYALFSYFHITYQTQLLLLVAALFVSVRLIFFLFGQRIIALDKITKYVYLIGYIILPIILLTQIPVRHKLFRPEIIIGIFVLIWTNDTFAFLVGKGFGKHKLLERVSPKKTIEGFFGGWFFALLMSFVISRYLVHESIYYWLAIATIVSYFGTIGDLIESKFKRMAGVKDSGRIMPGHGGILDRLDSVIFVAPFVFLFYQIIYYVS
jgi:phosphatidate cytidylyltransferase